MYWVDSTRERKSVCVTPLRCDRNGIDIVLPHKPYLGSANATTHITCIKRIFKINMSKGNKSIHKHHFSKVLLALKLVKRVHTIQGFLKQGAIQSCTKEWQLWVLQKDTTKILLYIKMFKRCSHNHSLEPYLWKVELLNLPTRPSLKQKEGYLNVATLCYEWRTWVLGSNYNMKSEMWVFITQWGITYHNVKDKIIHMT